MKTDHQDIELIERYLLQTLSPEEEKSFQNRLSDPDFQEELELQKDLMTALKTEGKAQFKAELETLDKEHFSTAKVKPFNPARYLRMAVAATVLLAAFYWVFDSFSGQSTLSPQEIYVQQFEPKSLSGVKSDVDSLSLWEQFMMHYAHQQYKEAIPVLESLLADPDYSQTSRARLYLGNAYLLTDQSEKAIETLKEIRPSSAFAMDAEWYTALAYLKNDDPDNARNQLKAIAEDQGHFYHQRAKKILSQL